MKLMICLLVVTASLGAAWFVLRKDMPYEFHIANINGDLFIHNKTIWNNRSLTVKFKIADKNGSTVLDGQSNTALIKGVSDGSSLQLRISRSDLKGKLIYKPFIFSGKVPQHKKKYIVFIGASIGRDWHLEELPNRQPSLHDTDIIYWPEYKFDKKKIIEHVLKIPIKPELLLLKECAAYFPRGEKESIKELKRWFGLLEESDIKSVAVTTVPVTNNHDPGKYVGRAESIAHYNKLLRQAEFDLFDIATVLASEKTAEQSLAMQYAVADGLHLNDKAYHILDQTLVDYLEKRSME